MAYREFTDEGGTAWRAWDTYPGSAANVRPGFEAGWLGFESDGEHRRLAPVPGGWEELPDEELRALLASAQPTRPARAPRAPDPDEPTEDTPDATHSVLDRVRGVLRSVDRTLRG
jgi:hypothetical protein